LRTVHSQQTGRQLAQAATCMTNWFRWQKSGPREPDFEGQKGMVYGPKTAWTRTRTSTGGVEHHPLKRNDFTAWLMAGGNQPNMNSYMNCWESVLFSAFVAALVGQPWLRIIHRKAALSYELQHRVGGNAAPTASPHYFLALSHAFGFFGSVPFEPRAGLVPRVGEILFWERDQHVAISLGRTWVNGQPQDRMMSLWQHNGGRFARLTLDDMPQWMRGSLRFLPCPF